MNSLNVRKPSVVNRTYLPIKHVTELFTIPSAEEFYQQFVVPGRPVVLRGAALHMQAIERWSADYLKTVAGQRNVPVEFSPDKEFALPERIGKDRIEAKFSDVVDYLLCGGNNGQTTYYLAQIDALRYLPELVSDVVRPPFAPLAKTMRPPYLWMGIGGNASTLHYDSYDNLYAVIRGRKHITLFPPEDRYNLYPYSDVKYRHFSQINLRFPDLEKFPRLLNTSPVECVLCRGDILYFPEGWWHYLRSQGLNFAVNWWWVEDNVEK